MRPILSICIPTFRRGEMVYSTVLDHLKIDNKEIEVVVSDNCSPDNTIQLLSSIADSRLKVYRNEDNMGFHYNLLRTIKEAKGHYACFMSDEDVFDHGELERIIAYLKECVEDKYEIGAVIPGHAMNFITKKEELLNALYGRCSYMSGLIINRDILEEEDFLITNENYYPHVQLVLSCGARARIVYSPYNLSRAKFNDGASSVERIELESKAKGSCKESPYTPESRCRQLNIEKNMILRLEISDSIKYELLKKQYYGKTVQATVNYEKYCRSLEKLHTLGIYRNESCIGIEKEMGEIFINTISMNFPSEYTDLAKEKVNEFTAYIREVRQLREIYDKMAREEGYTVIFAGKHAFINNYIDDLLDYDYIVDYTCIIDEKIEMKNNISIEQLESIEKIIILADKTDNYFLNQVKQLDLKKAYIISIQDLAIDG